MTAQISSATTGTPTKNLATLLQTKVSTLAQWLTIAIAGATLLMVTGVTWCGHQLAQKMKSEAQKKEQSITELQQAEELLKEQTLQLQVTLDNLQKTQLQLVQNEKMSSLGALVAGVAHEINNPVSFIHDNLPYVQNYSEQLLDLIRLYQAYFPTGTPEIVAKADEIDLEFLQQDLIKLLDSMRVGTDSNHFLPPNQLVKERVWECLSVTRLL